MHTSPQAQTRSPTGEIAMIDLGSDHALFDEAIEAIQRTISDNHRWAFRHHADISSLLGDFQAICDVNVKEHRRLVACSREFTLFVRSFAPYFDVLKICSQVRPDWPAWFWGTVRLVFKVGCSYVLFLEKIASLFESIAHALPQYRQIYESCKHQINFLGQSQDDRLTALMSYIYADIIQFCLDLYRIFSRGSQGAGLRHLRLESESASILWRPLDSRFAQLEARLLHHRRWLEAETEKEIQDYALIAHQRKEYIDFLKRQIETNVIAELESQRMAKRLRRVDKVKAWLSNCCTYRDVYEHRGRQRLQNSCAWFLGTEEYCNWKNAPFDQDIANDIDELERGWHDRVLFVQAKPGFGKTFISGAVIDDLGAEAEDLDISGEPPTAAFFHFNAAHLYCTHPNDALRALAYQLVHTHRHNRSTLDALCLLMRKATNHEKASSDDVLAILSLLLRQHATFLVLDGIDECSDVELFLTLLPELCRKSDVRIILFSRPGIDIPLSYQKWASDSPHIIYLREEQNARDIEAYVTENLNQMADQGFFGISMDRTLISQVAQRSNGMFLWASVLLKYLQSPGLVPNERRVALEHIHELEGLEALYCNILNMLDRRPQTEKQTITDIFRWLALSINRLCIPGLETALTITPGQATKDKGLLPNYAELIPQLSCGLVEVTDCSVIFTHRSVKEFLQSPACQGSDFSLFDESIAHAHLAARCISFLAHDMPKQPLGRLQPYIRSALTTNSTSSGNSMRTSKSGDSGYKSMSSVSDADNIPTPTMTNTQTNASSHSLVALPSFNINIPFLRYASLCWPIHLTRALSQLSSRAQPTSTQSVDSFEYTPWLPSLSTFLTDRAAVTAWVEASWRYNLPPNLFRLVPLLNALKAEIPPATVQGRELRWVVTGVRELAERLSELKEGYGTTLRENPSLIWQWRGHVGAVATAHGNGSGSSGFWPVWDEGDGRVNEVL